MHIHTYIFLIDQSSSQSLWSIMFMQFDDLHQIFHIQKKECYIMLVKVLVVEYFLFTYLNLHFDKIFHTLEDFIYQK
jgi:hypothetical protein